VLVGVVGFDELTPLDCDDEFVWFVSFFEFVDFPLPFVFGADVVVVIVVVVLWLVLLAGVNVEFDCMDVVDALTAADAVATPARVAAADAGGKLAVVVAVSVELEAVSVALFKFVVDASFRFVFDDPPFVLTPP
jgi:hypothetical protein